MPYTELPLAMHQPLGQQVPRDWTKMYSILDTDKWTVPTKRPPPCIKESSCLPCPVYTSGTGMDLMEFPGPRLINEKININYITNRINN